MNSNEKLIFMDRQTLEWTTLEQSKKLIEAGLDPNTADMFYTSLDMHETPWVWNSKPFLHLTDVPCWNLGKLIELMPKTIETKKPKNLYFPEILPASNGVAYTALNESKEMVFLKMFTTGTESNATLMDNMVSMVCWLLENNYIKREE